ncbi:MarR family transcriptional regulator [Dictyobacter alpinus]|uniref:MarR family transcriptional regulator n=1 Tax=Dictyobacter alpinus TaxID=2014873 RepID=A0A402BJY7_9CHLR|nr:MarR family transcriptional regulator [Dictyobacter alpinus]GCE31654.1 MarR family transcriptional regulator [Dictyobacter alpinus]
MTISSRQEDGSDTSKATNRWEQGQGKIDDMLCFALYAASRAAMDVYRPLLDKFGLTYPQYLVMVVLWDRETCSVKDIGRTLHLDSGTLSPLLKRLESTGFIKRQRRTQDERVVDISLTDEGRALRERAVDVPMQVSCRYGIEFDEYVTLLEQLKKLTARLA